MGIILNGSKPSKIIYNGAESALYFNGSKIWPEVAPDPPLPPIAANTVRVRTSDGNVPSSSNYESATLVTGTTDVYDCYSSTFDSLLSGANNVVEILGANLGNQTSLSAFCSNCASLTTVALFDTSNVTNMQQMFMNCTSLTTVPLFNTSSVTNVQFAFGSCINVESGALALYQQMSTQATPPSSHRWAFRNCGRDTTTGAAELAQIPSDWK